jgi:hypothetical protein
MEVLKNKGTNVLEELLTAYTAEYTKRYLVSGSHEQLTALHQVIIAIQSELIFRKKQREHFSPGTNYPAGNGMHRV